MPLFTQDKRLLTIESPLGRDVLLLTSFSGQEEMSQLFRYELELLSEDGTIAPRDIVGKSLAWAVNNRHTQPRYFHGHVRRWVAGGKNARGLHSYRAEVVPWLWFLTLSSNCRIFQHQTVPEIVQALFNEFGFRDYRPALQETYAPREYCVQYRETVFDFIGRLLEQEGIFYFFRHEQGRHTLVLGDRAAAYKDCPEPEAKLTAGETNPNRLTAWEHAYEFRAGRWAQTDYNFETPRINLFIDTQARAEFPGAGKFEKFDYPGQYRQRAEGTTATQVRMEEEEAHLDVASGEGGYCTFAPGGKFRLVNHHREPENQDYVITSIRHSATEPTYGASTATADYRNTFRCIPAAIVFRPVRTTPKPVIAGTQTAVVVAPLGEELLCDRYGRVKVQFHWDRQGKRDENSSCWLRVAQVWAGKRWGAFFWPRVGHEVVVSFEEGDPDRPLIIGSVYNATNMPPLAMPAENQSCGIKSCSVGLDSSWQFNGLLFRDVPGDEEVTLHSTGDLFLSCNNDMVPMVGGHLHTVSAKTNFEMAGAIPLPSSKGSPLKAQPSPAAAPASGGSSQSPAGERKSGDGEPRPAAPGPLKYDNAGNWGFSNPAWGGALSLGPTVAFKATYGFDGKAFLGLSPAWSFGSSWKTTINPLGLVGEFDCVSARPWAALIASALGGDLGFTVGAGMKFSYGPSYSMTHGKDIKLTWSKEYGSKDALDRLAKTLAAGYGLATLTSMALLMAMGDPRGANGNKVLSQIGHYTGIGFGAMAGACLIALGAVETKMWTRYRVQQARQKVQKGLLARNGQLVEEGNEDLKKALNDLQQLAAGNPNATSALDANRAETATATDGDWKVFAGGIQLTAVEQTNKASQVSIRALTGQSGKTGQVSIQGDSKVEILGGANGVTIKNAELSDKGTITIGDKDPFYRGPVKLECRDTSVSLNGTAIRLRFENVFGQETSIQLDRDGITMASGSVPPTSLTLKTGEIKLAVGLNSLVVNGTGVTINGTLVEVKATTGFRSNAVLTQEN